MFKRIAVLGIFILLFAFAAQPARADDPPGAKLFATYCAACHGAAGKGSGAPALSTDAYLNAHDDATITQITSDGKMEKGMPMWSKAKGGTLSDAQIADIVAYLRAFVAPAAPAPAPTAAPVAAVYSQTTLSMKQTQNADGSMVFVATLIKTDGTPAVGAAIAFARPASMGKLDLGTIKTDKLGNASITVRDQPEQARYITATFAGEPMLGSSEAMLALARPLVDMSTGSVNTANVRLALGDEPLLAPEGSLITSNPPLVPTTLFILLVVGIWSIYAFVISQVVGIWKDGRPAKPRENTITMKRKPIR